MSISGSERCREISVSAHSHKLRWTVRGDCDFVICDACAAPYKGPSWHCTRGCDFDVCDECVVRLEGDVEVEVEARMDEYLAAYLAQSAEMREIESADAQAMKLRTFSRGVDRKRKRKEKRLGLMGLEEEVVKAVKATSGLRKWVT